MRSTRDDIVLAAMARFARDGFATPLRAIAADAGVSAGLIVHHFGSKQGLRDAVDAHVVGLAEEKMRRFDEGGTASAVAMVATILSDGNLPRYLARVLVDGGEAGTRLFDSFVNVTEKALIGLDLDDRRMVAAMAVTHSLGVMVMAPQIGAAVGTELFSGEGVSRMAPAVIAIYRGALAPLTEVSS